MEITNHSDTTEKVAVSGLSPHPLNEQIYTMSNIDDLVASIQEVGLLVPLVINSTNQVISGNRRLCAINILGWNEVEITRVDVKEEEVSSILIHHNKQRVKSCKELINEYRTLETVYSIGMGRRTDLDPTYGQTSRGSTTREILAKKLGVNETKIARLLYINDRNPDYIDLVDDGVLTIHKAHQHLQDGHKYTFAHGENRKPNDFYTTPYSLTEHLLRVEDFNKDHTICEPATGNGAITDVLEKYWRADLITSYDIETDFLKDENDYDYIITNPPFSKAIDFIQQAKRRARWKFCLLLPLNYLHGKKRYEAVYADKEYGLSKVHVFTRSLLMDDETKRPDGGVKAGMLVFAWYVFENGYGDAPTLSWIVNDADLIPNSLVFRTC